MPLLHLVFQNDVADVFHVFLADGDMKSFTYNQQTTVTVSKELVTHATLASSLSRSPGVHCKSKFTVEST